MPSLLCKIVLHQQCMRNHVVLCLPQHVRADGRVHFSHYSACTDALSCTYFVVAFVIVSEVERLFTDLV